jgi:hypothetical protein
VSLQFLVHDVALFPGFEWGREARNTAGNSSMGVCYFQYFEFMHLQFPAYLGFFFSVSFHYGSKHLMVVYASFFQIRDASWSVFEALPTITSLGVAAVNGLAVVYLRGSMNAVEGFKGTLVFYSNQMIINSTYYKELVSDTTGDPIGPPSTFDFGTPVQHMQWFQEALTVPLNNLTWNIGRSHISKLCAYIYSDNYVFLELVCIQD